MVLFKSLCFAVFQVAILSFWSLGLTGCTSSKSNSDFIPQNPRPSILENLNKATLSCETSSTCPENVGYVVMNTVENDEVGVAQCTGFLVAPDIVATNSHCIPSQVKIDPANCKSDLGIKFPASGAFSEEVALCSRVLHFSDLSEETDKSFFKKSDYAFFKLQTSVQRKPFILSREGVSEDIALASFSVNPMSKTELVGVIVSHKCSSRKNSILLPADTNSFSSVAAIFGENCNVRPGNSGSPILNDRGQVVALLHAGMIKGANSNYNIPSNWIESELQQMVIVTNLACLPFLADLPSFANPPGDCGLPENNKSEETLRGEREEKLLADLQIEAEKQFDEWSMYATNVLQMDGQLELKATEKLEGFLPSTFQPKIVCLKPSANWSDSNRVSYYSENHSSIGRSLSISLQVPKFQVVSRLDPFWRWKLVVTNRLMELWSIQFKKFLPDTVIGTISTGFAHPPSQDTELRWCSPEETYALPQFSFVTHKSTPVVKSE